jgi:hypothetical protein
MAFLSWLSPLSLVFLQQRLQGFIDGLPGAEDPGAHGTHRTLHDARNVLVTQTIEFT